MKKRKFKYVTVGFILLFVLFLTSCRQAQMNPAQFLQNEGTFSAYSLFDDNINPMTTYPHLNLVGSDDTYMYESLTGDERYLFTTIDDVNEYPILSYFRVSANSENGSLLKVGIGEQTIVYKNSTLNIHKTYSIYEYLKDMGFEYNNDFPLKYSNELADQHIIWFYLKKDNVFINYAVNTDKYLTLHAYEVGIIDDSVYDILSLHNQGYNLVIEHHDHTLMSTNKSAYAMGDYINLRVLANNKPETMKLYINDTYIKDFEYKGYYFEASFYMFAEDVVVEIISE